jgi:benzoyl-CoA reductase/2-hydroxyglutaryl-CoA dehydratase subunit BcrC/BadD/HgdB
MTPAATTTGLESQLAYIRHDREVTHAYSPAVARLYDLAVDYVHHAEQAHARGEQAVWTLGLWEVPLIYACGTIPVAFPELGRLGSSASITVAEDHFQIPRETCSMVSAILGEWWLRKASGIRKVLAFNAACEPFNMAWELIKNEGFQVHRIDTVYLPAQVDPARFEALVAFLTEELRGTGRWLTGGELDPRRLALELRRRNRILAKVRKILALRQANPLYIRSLATMYLLMGSGHYLGQPEAYESVLDELLVELEQAPFIAAADGRPVVPILWCGARGQEFGVYQAVDDCGAAILGWMTPNAFARDYREDLDPVEALARYYLDGQLAGASVHRRGILTQQLAQSRARGILFYNYVGCSFGGVTLEMERAHFHGQGIPSICLEGTFQVGPPSGQLLTRIRAFVEMLT